MLTRRKMLIGAAATAGLAACDQAVSFDGPARIEARVAAIRQQMLAQVPGASGLVGSAKGVLIMPVVTEAGLGVGGAYGEGALQINGATVDYYSSTKASVGLQAGAQQYAHMLIFRTDAALADFRSSQGWVAGSGAYYTLPNMGWEAEATTLTLQHPIVAVVFGQSGLMAGAAIEGTKYTRIVPTSRGWKLAAPQMTMPQWQMPTLPRFRR